MTSGGVVVEKKGGWVFRIDVKTVEQYNSSLESRGGVDRGAGATATVRRRFGVAISGDSNQQIHSILPLEAV